MPRQNFVDGMELTFGDLSNIPVRTERALYDRVLFHMLQSVENAFFGSSLAVSRVSATEVQVAAGVGFQTDNAVTAPEPTKRVIYQAAVENLSIQSPDATNPRIDLVCVKAARANTSSATRKFKDASTAAITDETLVIETDWDPTFQVVEGTAAASPSAPAVPSGYVKLAELTVTAVTGIAASGAITDSRTKLPVGGDILLNTSALSVITAGTETKLDTIISDIDAQLTGGGGGGGGMQWFAGGPTAAMELEEYGRRVLLFPHDRDAKAVVHFMVPASYVAGNQIQLFLGFYSPGASGNVKMKTTTTLIRSGTDAVDSTTNQHSGAPAELTSSVAKQMRRQTFDLTDADGEVNSVAVSAGDLLIIELERDYALETSSDANEVRFIPDATEPKLS